MAHCDSRECAYCRAEELYAEDFYIARHHGTVRAYLEGCDCLACLRVGRRSDQRLQASADRAAARRRTA